MNLAITVAFATPTRQILCRVSLAEGSTVADALAHPAVTLSFKGIAIHALPIGIHGRRVQPEQCLTDQDRVELYRPLQCDPKTRRRRLADKKR